MVGLPYKVQATKRYGGERAAPCHYRRRQEVFSSGITVDHPLNFPKVCRSKRVYDDEREHRPNTAEADPVE